MSSSLKIALLSCILLLGVFLTFAPSDAEACSSTQWRPSRSDYCPENTFTQRRNRCSRRRECFGSGASRRCRNRCRCRSESRRVTGSKRPSYDPPRSAICAGVEYTARTTNCNPDYNEELIGTKSSTRWGPGANPFCSDVEISQIGNCIYEGGLAYNHIKDVQGESDSSNPHYRRVNGAQPRNYEPDLNLFCTSETVDQVATCHGDPDSYHDAAANYDAINDYYDAVPPRHERQKNGLLEESTSFVPDPSEFCSGEKFMQVGAECGEFKEATGDAQVYTESGVSALEAAFEPPAEDVCQGEEFTQTQNCAYATDYDKNNEPDPLQDPPVSMPASSIDRSDITILYRTRPDPNVPNDPMPVGTKETGSCCKEEPENFSPLPETFCASETKLVETKCSGEIPMSGTKTTDECCTTDIWLPDPASVCKDEEFVQTHSCSGEVEIATGTKETGSCVAEPGDCLPGIPCYKPFTPDIKPFDNAPKPNFDGPNAQKSESLVCDADIMNQIHAKAFLHAQREKSMIQTVVTKPDSVLEYSCFRQFVNVGSYWLPKTFSETKIWSKTECEDDTLCNTANLAKSYEVEIEGEIDDVPQPPTYLEVYMGAGMDDDESRLGYGLESLVMESLHTYLNEGENFTHTFLGGQMGANQTVAGINNNKTDGLVEPNKVYVCARMLPVWMYAKCDNFNNPLSNPMRVIDPTGNLVSDFAYVMSPDMRMYPAMCEQDDDDAYGSKKNWMKYQMVAANNPIPIPVEPITRAVYPHAQVDLATSLNGLPGGIQYTDFLRPDVCESPIPTGIEVTTYKFETNFFGTVNTTPVTFEEHICPNPNCYYNYDPNNRSGECVQ